MKVQIMTTRQSLFYLAGFLDTSPMQGTHKFAGWWVQKETSRDGKDRPAIRFSFPDASLESYRCVCALQNIGINPVVNGERILDIDVCKREEARLLAILLSVCCKNLSVLHELECLINYVDRLVEKAA